MYTIMKVAIPQLHIELNRCCFLSNGIGVQSSTERSAWKKPTPTERDLTREKKTRCQVSSIINGWVYCKSFPQFVFYCVYDFPTYRVHPVHSSKTVEDEMKKANHDAEKQTKNYQNEWETVFCRFCIQFAPLHIFSCVSPSFDPLFMIISVLMQRYFLLSRLLPRAILLYDTAFTILALSFFVSPLSLCRPTLSSHKVRIYFIRCAYDRADCLCD